MMSVLACASHLLVDLPLFGGPVLTVIAAVVVLARRELVPSIAHRRRRHWHDRSSPLRGLGMPDRLGQPVEHPGRRA
jgi:hypothetical protein